MLNPLFLTSVSSFFVHSYLAFTKINSFLILPIIGTITSLWYHNIHSKYNNKHLQKLDKGIITTGVFWDFLWIIFSDISQTYKYISIANILLTLVCYYLSNLIYKFYNHYYNIIGLQLHILTHILATFSNVTIFLLIDKEPDNPILKIGQAICILGTYNMIFRYFFRNKNYPESYCTDYASKITSIIFQIFFCYCTIFTLLAPLNSQEFKSYTIKNTCLLSAYFCYDIIALLSTSRGNSQVMYLSHHIVSLYLIALINLSCSSNLITLYHTNILGLVFEVANPFLNMMKLLRSLYPKSILYFIFFYMSKITYFGSRIVILPLVIVYFYKDNITIINPYSFYQVIIGLSGLCILSITWCTQLFAMNQ